MRNDYFSRPWSTLLSAAALLWLWLGATMLSQAQVYYAVSDGNFATTTDQLRRINPDGTGDVLLKSNFIQTPGQVVLDAANNRLLIADIRASQPTATTNSKIVAVSLASGNAATTFVTPAFIAGSTTTAVSSLVLDRANNYLYYTVSDGNFATTTDQLRRINLDGTGDVLLKSNFIQTPGPMVLDAANNRLLIADIRASQPTATTNSKIVAVSLASGNAVSTFLTPAFIAGSTTTAVSSLAIDQANSSLYYTVNDGSFATTTDQLRRINLNGTGDVLLKSNFIQTPGPMVLDAANNRLLIADIRASQPTATTNSKIVAVSLASGNAVSTFLTPAFIAGSTTTAVSGLAVPEAAAPTVATATPTPSTITSTGATLGGNVTADGGATVTERGVVYSSTNATPTIGSGTKVVIGANLGSFSQAVTGLSSSTLYYVRAYATNTAGTSYGSVVSFSTLAPATVASLVRADASPTNAVSVRYTLTFSQPVTGLSPSNFVVVGAGVSGANVRTVTGAGTTYTITVNTGAGNGTIELRLANTIGLSPEVSNVPFSGQTYTIDRTPPVVSGVVNGGVYNSARTITFDEGTATLNGNPFTSGSTVSTEGTYTLVVTDAATNATTVSFTLDLAAPTGTLAINGGAARTNSTSVTLNLTSSGATQMRFSNDGTTFTAFEPIASTKAWTLPTGDGPKTVYLQLQDAAGNISASITDDILLDQTAPTVTSLTRFSPTTIATNLTSVTFRVIFSESVTGVEVSDFTLNTGGATGNVTAVSGTGTSYDVTVSGIAGNGSLFPNLRVGSVTDLAGNLNTAGSTSGEFYVIDNLAPETVFTATPPATSNSATATFTFSGTDTNGSGVVGFQASLDGVAFTSASSPVTLTGLADGPHNFQVRAVDAAGNVDATPASYNWTIDATIPTVSIGSVANNPTSTSPIPVVVMFSEIVTDFIPADVSVNNGTVTDFSSGGSGRTYTFNVTPAASGTVTVNIAANVAQDAAGNGNTAATPFSIQYNVPNQGPTDLQLSRTSVAENAPVNTLVGTFSSTDPNTGDTFTYALVSGAGATDNAAFTIPAGTNTLRTAAVFDYETKNSYSIRVRTTDAGGLSYEKALTIQVTNVNEAPVVANQTFTIGEGAPAGTVVGTVVASDPDAGQTLTYSITAGNTDGAFRFSGNQLQVANMAALNYGTTPTFTLTVQVADNSLASTATITVTLTPATQVLYRLNAGGPAVNTSLGSFAADQYFSPSRTGANSGPIAGTTDDALYQTERFEGAFGYSLRVPNGTYQVVLHFAELYWTQPGQRIFDVRAENQLVLDNYDILKKVAPFTATTETFSVVVTDGVLNLDLSALQSDGGRDAAKLSALEVLSRSSGPNQPPVLANQSFSVVEGSAPGTLVGTVVASDPDAGQRLTYSLTAGNTDGAFTFVGNQLQVANAAAVRSATSPFTLSVRVTDDGQPALSATATVTVSVTPGMQVLYRLHAGGPAVNTSLGQFAADQYFSPSRTGANSGPIAGTTDDALYQTERFEGAFGYSLRVPNGTYQVVLHFAELYWTQPGQRLFDVRAENQLVLDNYDILRKVAPFTATTETFSVVVTDGVLNLDLSALESDGGRDAAKLSALEVLSPSSRASTSLASNAVLPTAASGRLAARLEAAPNPAADQVRVSFQLPRAEAYTLAVYDLTGRTLSQQGGQPVAAGERQQVRLSLGAYPVGVYLIRLTTASGTQQVRVVKN
ncbi:malectin domain-containing carbohydrate-binding protein [Hymenobacter sp. GOD-10R]|uniref:malectin domain-containing carbohydrate-binding protein n=1 Tax=Hymenobacter sp. GOD-10R TaxID=3093922 RepID=UPI002D783087|nr:malectin domain-containing carbohydrate-binding protein [Hymenobacter sp. GOD-10R]WRQ31127.1 malectin domain-containing carbohydrate-binding protein [Hymenobacter sp. GOD-10R]